MIGRGKAESPGCRHKTNKNKKERKSEMKILDAKFVQDFIKMADDGYQQGWHERNGGNLSYRIKPEEVEIIRNRLDEKGEWTPIGVSVPDLAGEFFMVTGTGKYFRNIIVDPEACLTIIEAVSYTHLVSHDG